MTKPLHVLHVLETAQYAGTESHVLTLIGALDPARARTALLCRDNSPLHRRARAAGIPCHVCPDTRSMARLLRRERFDVLHAHDGRSKLRSLLAATLSGGRSRVVATQHFLQPAHTQRHGWKGRLSAVIHHAANQRLSETIAISVSVRDAALARREVAPNKITVVPNGIRAEEAALPSPAVTRAALGLAPDVPLIVCAARLEAEKDLPTLIAAMARIHRQCPAAVCLIAGEGSQRPRLDSQIETGGLTQNIRLLGFRDDATALIAAATLDVYRRALGGTAS